MRKKRRLGDPSSLVCNIWADEAGGHRSACDEIIRRVKDANLDAKQGWRIRVFVQRPKEGGR